MSTIKFQVIECWAQDLKCDILATFFEYPEATAFINKHIQEAYDIGSFTKCYHENSKTLSVYRYNYIMPKTLVSKIHIIEFDDIDD